MPLTKCNKVTSPNKERNLAKLKTKLKLRGSDNWILWYLQKIPNTSTVRFLFHFTSVNSIISILYKPVICTLFSYVSYANEPKQEFLQSWIHWVTKKIHLLWKNRTKATSGGKKSNQLVLAEDPFYKIVKDFRGRKSGSISKKHLLYKHEGLSSIMKTQVRKSGWDNIYL